MAATTSTAPAPRAGPTVRKARLGPRPGELDDVFLAAWNGQVEAVRILIDVGAEPNPIGRTAMTAAARGASGH
jgi:hypothetical protein